MPFIKQSTRQSHSGKGDADSRRIGLSYGASRRQIRWSQALNSFIMQADGKAWGAALMAASALTRFGVFEAGRASARDPKYTVGPQRQRLREQGEHAT